MSYLSIFIGIVPMIYLKIKMGKVALNPATFPIFPFTVEGRQTSALVTYESKSNPDPGTGSHAGLHKRLCKAHLAN